MTSVLSLMVLPGYPEGYDNSISWRRVQVAGADSTKVDAGAFRPKTTAIAAIAEVAREARGQTIVRLKKRKETLRVSQPYAHLFRQM